jgi:hypothetical protein
MPEVDKINDQRLAALEAANKTYDAKDAVALSAARAANDAAIALGAERNAALSAINEEYDARVLKAREIDLKSNNGVNA